jgi:RNA polymerase sigma-70 factor (ECF subfamily)
MGPVRVVAPGRCGVYSLEWREPGEGFVTVPAIGEDQRREDAFACYVLPEVAVLARVARALTHNGADAEDLVQETLLSAFRAMERFDGAHPRAWLLTIMRNAEAKRHRRRRPRLLREGEPVEPWVGSDPGNWLGSPEHVVVGREFDAVVAHSLAALPDRHRQVLELVDINGLSYAEAAEVIGVPVGTVMSRLHRARSRIRHRLTAAGLAPKRSLR